MIGLLRHVTRAASSVLAAVSVAGLITLGLVACGDGDAATDGTAGSATALGESVTSVESTSGAEASLIGKWHSEQTGETMEFTADGRLIVTSGGGAITEMNYTVDGSSISYVIEGTVVYTGTYSVDGDVLSQVDPDIEGTVYFDRVE